MNSGSSRNADPQFQNMLEQYSTAMKWFGQQKFDRAKPILEKVRSGPYRELADRAALHWNACNQRLQDQRQAPQSGEELYQLAVIRMNLAQYNEAEELLENAIKRDGKKPHYVYAQASLRALTNDLEVALVTLQEAISGDQQCRLLARNDHDFDALMDDPRFTEILYPERA